VGGLRFATAISIYSSRATRKLTFIICPPKIIPSKKISSTKDSRSKSLDHGWRERFFISQSRATHFEEVSKKAGVDDPAKRFGLGVVWGDYDNQGWPSLLVANDTGPNFLYRNKHDGTFLKKSPCSAASRSALEGQEVGNNGAWTWAIYSADGKLDFTITNYADQPKGCTSIRATRASPTSPTPQKSPKLLAVRFPGHPGFADFSNSGLPEYNHRQRPRLSRRGHRPQKRQVSRAHLLFRNKGDRTFDEISRTGRAQ